LNDPASNDAAAPRRHPGDPMNARMCNENRKPARDGLAAARPEYGELDYLYVKIDRFASVLQEKYGLSRAEAMRKVAELKRAFNEEAPHESRHAKK
jgi:hypothetical protein